MKKFDCPCCQSVDSVAEDAIGMFARCSVCGWEDDGVQQNYPDELGSNGKWTLNVAKKAWENGETLFPDFPNPKAKS